MYVGTPVTTEFELESAVDIPSLFFVRVGANTHDVGRVSEVALSVPVGWMVSGAVVCFVVSAEVKVGAVVLEASEGVGAGCETGTDAVFDAVCEAECVAGADEGLVTTGVLVPAEDVGSTYEDGRTPVLPMLTVVPEVSGIEVEIVVDP